MSLQSTTHADQQAFPQTEVGATELKTIPASRMIVSECKDHYFSENNGLFRPLFRYISRNDIAMTTPVEAEMMPGRMYFYIGADASHRELSSTDEVKVVDLPERLVASIGVRGGYTRENFNAARKQLQAWLNSHPTHKADGEARGVFWNGPYVPWFLKRFEVHLPVIERSQNAD
ncbi:hypothetical protein DDZ13_01190 [Coraliomargarita sinensis]|uniref:Uncharacterized protein n=1 Tax=Coraliomargarita sinensis TaxID=2174842 RepID=A0A317ZIS9_9BACT|nr:heme-binding protein [Coraliomargarita sinensis]PXA05515.1 hypothetical protein DDZ13_01190 [Coraliomargarita sinensis]